MILMRMKNSKIAIIITAAGSSTRMGGNIKKEYLPFKDGTVLSNCAKTFLNACSKSFEITDFIITCPKNGIDDCKKALKSINLKNIKIIEGAQTRQKSVFEAIKAIENNPDVVAIHDGARPFVSEELILRTIEAAVKFGASVPGLTPIDTQKEIDDNGFILRHLQRSKLTAVQTPQCFEFTQLAAAHQKADSDGKEYTDDTEIWGVYCGNVKVVDGDVNNIKITYPADLQKLEK